MNNFIYTDITIGADIEVFVANKNTNEIISAEPYIPGSKDEPFCFDKTNHFFAVSLDNVLAEFCIPPVVNKNDFYNHIQKSMGYINSILPAGLTTIVTPAAMLDPKYLQTEHSKMFGCMPDYNAYTGQENSNNVKPDPCLRSAGGHVHVGFKNAALYDDEVYKMDQERSQLIKAMDLYLGVPSVIMEPENQRKLLYGKAGAFRPKPYGLEYRTISNYYLATPEQTMWVYDATQAAIAWLNNGGVVENGLGLYIQEAINTSNVEMANTLIKSFNLKLAA